MGFWWNEAAVWMAAHWEVPFLFCIGYVVMVFWLPEVMKNRPPMNLKWWLVSWNAFLALFSIVGAYYTIPITFRGIVNHGQNWHFCDKVPDTHPWIMLFCLSKIPELVDTLFLILRKKPVIFLHWYHHTVTLLYCWWGWSSQTTTGRTFAVMNLFVHSIMYSYYGIMAAGYRLPKSLAKGITYLQISQMIAGLYTCTYGALYCDDDNTEQRSFNTVGSIMYISYALLFIQMFFSKYNEDGSLKGSKKPLAQTPATPASQKKAE